MLKKIFISAVTKQRLNQIFDREDSLLAQGLISRQALAHRRLLRQVMQQAGFIPLKTEWWHFNKISRAQAKAHYKPIR